MPDRPAVTKRSLRADKPKSSVWLDKSHEERLAAVETIRSTSFATDDSKQEFQRVYRSSRKTRG
jgi:hypothetical protein